jgi:hypothetical protein
VAAEYSSVWAAWAQLLSALTWVAQMWVLMSAVEALALMSAVQAQRLALRRSMWLPRL